MMVRERTGARAGSAAWDAAMSGWRWRRARSSGAQARDCTVDRGGSGRLLVVVVRADQPGLFGRPRRRREDGRPATGVRGSRRAGHPRVAVEPHGVAHRHGHGHGHGHRADPGCEHRGAFVHVVGEVLHGREVQAAERARLAQRLHHRWRGAQQHRPAGARRVDEAPVLLEAAAPERVHALDTFMRIGQLSGHSAGGVDRFDRDGDLLYRLLAHEAGAYGKRQSQKKG